MSSPRRASNGANSSEENNDIQRKSSNLSKLRRLASNEDNKALFSVQANEGIQMETPPEDSPATVLNDMILDASKRKSSRVNADIRNFVEKEYHKSTAARELIRHLIFVVILIAGVTLHRSAFESFLMNQALITSFITQETDFDLQPFPKSFQDVGQPDELRDWLISVVGGTLDSDEFYSGRPKTEDEMDYVMFANRLLGGVRIRQLRAAPNKDCKIPNQLKDITNSCYAYSYGPSNRDRAPFGPPENTTKYTYSSPEETGSVSIIGYILDFLDGGGYTVDMNLERRDEGITFTEQLEELINDTWIDPATRAVIISMVFLNTELESRVSVLYLIIEIPGNGAIFPSYMLKTFRLNLYVVPLDYFRLVLEILFVLFVLYAIYAEVWEMVKNHRMGGKGLKKYFYNGWNLIELVDIVLYICVISMYTKYLLAPERYKAKLDSRVYHSDMERLAATALIFYNICAINVIITTFRTFKYLKLNHRLYLLWKALRHAGADLIGFLFIFLIFIFGFIFMGWLSFGADLEEFNTFVHAFSTCWTFIIGNAPDYDAMFRSNRLLGPLFFVLFTIFIFFILANMFIAIISNSFEVVNEDVDDDAKFKDLVEEKVSELVNTMKKLYYQVTNKEDNKQRGIMQLLDILVDPEALEKPNVTPEDVAKAIGPTATKAEVEDLYKWTKKLEAKNATKRVKENRSSKSGLMSAFGIEDGVEDEEAEASVGSPKSLTRQQVADLISASPVMVDNDTKAAIKELQNQMKELKDMLRLTHRRNTNNNNNADSD